MLDGGKTPPLTPVLGEEGVGVVEADGACCHDGVVVVEGGGAIEEEEAAAVAVAARRKRGRVLERADCAAHGDAATMLAAPAQSASVAMTACRGRRRRRETAVHRDG